MYLMIDNYDSFVYNLRAYFQEIGREILVKRCDELSLEDIKNLQPEGIILSPGPKRPQDAFLCVEALKQFQGKIPVLGVCLGHQVIGYCSGASVQKGRTPMHGKITAIRHNGTGCFAGPVSYTHLKALTKRFRSIQKIYSACGYRITHGLAPQSTETEPVNCFITAIAGHRRYHLKSLYYKTSRAQ